VAQVLSDLPACRERVRQIAVHNNADAFAALYSGLSAKWEHADVQRV
jgi:hypothetical protein